MADQSLKNNLEYFRLHFRCKLYSKKKHLTVSDSLKANKTAFFVCDEKFYNIIFVLQSNNFVRVI